MRSVKYEEVYLKGYNEKICQKPMKGFGSILGFTTMRGFTNLLGITPLTRCIIWSLIREK